MRPAFDQAKCVVDLVLFQFASERLHPIARYDRIFVARPNPQNIQFCVRSFRIGE
jgi:hypothetical protein